MSEPSKDGRHGPPGEWGGAPRLWLLALLAAASAGAFAVAVDVAAGGHRGSATGAPRHQRSVRIDRPLHAPVHPARRTLRTPGPVFCAAAHGSDVALTFDDGPGAQTFALLRILRHAGARATFFMVGRRALANPEAARAAAWAGNAIGDHTLTHALLTAIPHAAAGAEIASGRAAVERATGVRVRLFRPPYEAHDAWIDRRARALGLRQVLWNVDTRDARGAGVREIVQRARRGLRPGSIILMHENPRTVHALPYVLRSLRHRGLRAVTVPELLARGRGRHFWRSCPATG